jgi:hypothetical protein
MHLSSSLFCALLLTLVATCCVAMSSPAPPRTVVQHYQPNAKAQAGWQDQGNFEQLASSAQQPTTSFTVLLQQRNLDELNKLSQAVSDPNSPQYGKFLTPQQIADMTQPTKADQDRAVQWLKDALKLTDAQIENTGDSIKIRDASVSNVQQAFQCQMHAFKEQTPEGADEVDNNFQPRVLHRCVSDVSVPTHVSDVIVGSLGLIDFPTRYNRGPHPHPIPVGPNPAIEPVEPMRVPHRRQLRDPKQMREVAMKWAREHPEQQQQ